MIRKIRVVLIATDNREHHRRYDLEYPYFGSPIEALLSEFAVLSDLEVHVISCAQKPMRSPQKLAENTWFHILNVPKIGWLRTGYQGCIRAIRHKLLDIRPDIVHGQGTERECALGAVFSGFPNILTIHGNIRKVAQALGARIGSYWWCTAQLERFALSRTMGVLCNSNYTKSMAAEYARTTWVVPNAIRREFFDTPFLPNPPAPRPLLLNVGTIVSYKRQLVILQIAEELHGSGYDFELKFIGAANLKDKYAAAFLERLTARDNQSFVQHLTIGSAVELITLMDKASALIHLPSEEAFGVVVVEALSRNLKFFGTAIGGIPDIANGVDGAELFPLTDERMLRNAIALWLESGCPRPTSTAAEMKKRFHPQVIAAHHLRIYKMIASAGGNLM